jgi:hypothetical protein
VEINEVGNSSLNDRIYVLLSQEPTGKGSTAQEKKSKFGAEKKKCENLQVQWKRREWERNKKKSALKVCFATSQLHAERFLAQRIETRK